MLLANSRTCREVDSSWSPAAGVGRLLVFLCSVIVAALIGGVGRAELQFDVFVGYGSSGSSDGIVREGCWFPVACEVFNDGSSFDAVFEFSSLQTGGGQVRRMRIELPTNTRKRFCFPLFAGTSRYATWQARLLDTSGRLRAERPDIQVQDISRESYLLGGLARSFAGLPVFPPPGSARGPQARVARMTVEQFPDNPLALEGLNALYINSEKAVELKVGQVSALTMWVRGGGVLVVGIEQIQDIESTGWLRELVGFELTGAFTNRSRGEVHRWLTTQPGSIPGSPYAQLEQDNVFEEGEFLAFTATAPSENVRLAVGGKPLAVAARCGRGEVITLLFSPEREPFKSWKHRQWFWPRLLGVSNNCFRQTQGVPYGGLSMDGVFGAMIETRQTRKLPVEWLLLLLAIYLIVIGPLDYWWLKKINRQMLTWLTFPAYVAIFSLLIYWLGYKLRAGETEWNELHLTDVLEAERGVILRGRTFASLYSSANAKYKLASDLPNAALRSEYRGFIGGGQESSRVNAELIANAFRAEVAVPVWSSLMYISDWVQQAEPPLVVSMTQKTNEVTVTIENRLSRPLGQVFLAYQNTLYTLGGLAAGQRNSITISPETGTDLFAFVRFHGARFQSAAMARNQAFGHIQQSRLDLVPETVVAASFADLLTANQGAPQQSAGPPGVSIQRGFVSPPGQDLSDMLRKGDAVLLVWDPDQSPVPGSLIRSKVPRVARNNMYRLTVPVTYTR